MFLPRSFSRQPSSSPASSSRPSSPPRSSQRPSSSPLSSPRLSLLPVSLPPFFWRQLSSLPPCAVRPSLSMFLLLVLFLPRTSSQPTFGSLPFVHSDRKSVV